VVVLVIAYLSLVAMLLSVSGAWKLFSMRMYLVPEPHLFEALGAARAFCVVVVILSFETRAAPFHGVLVYARLGVAVCSYVWVIVGVVAAHIEEVDCFETHIRRCWKIRLFLSERRGWLEGKSWATRRGF
jgi:hypothetical protein